MKVSRKRRDKKDLLIPQRRIKRSRSSSSSSSDSSSTSSNSNSSSDISTSSSTTSTTSNTSTSNSSSASDDKYKRGHKRTKRLRTSSTSKRKTIKHASKVKHKKRHEETKKKKLKTPLKKKSAKPTNKSDTSNNHTEGEVSNDVPIHLMNPSKSMVPMTKEQWEKQQKVIRKVYDESTGRHRLIKGDGEVIEEIVSKEQHKKINKQATQGDGTYFQKNLALNTP